MTLTLFPVRLIVVVIIKIASIRIRRVTILPLFRFSATGFSIVSLLLAIPLSRTVFVNFGSLVVCVVEIRSITRPYENVGRLLLTTLSSSILVIPRSIRVYFVLVGYSSFFQVMVELFHCVPQRIFGLSSIRRRLTVQR